MGIKERNMPPYHADTEHARPQSRAQSAALRQHVSACGVTQGSQHHMLFSHHNSGRAYHRGMCQWLTTAYSMHPYHADIVHACKGATVNTDPIQGIAVCSSLFFCTGVAMLLQWSSACRSMATPVLLPCPHICHAHAK